MRLLGSTAFEPAGGTALPLTADLNTAIIASLAATPGWVSRSELAARVWPDRTEATARTNLRWHLHQSRKRPWGVCLEHSGDHLRWAAASDVLDFERAVEADDDAAAITWYGGPLAVGTFGDEPASLAHWFEARRDELHARWHRLLLERSDAVGADMLFEALLLALHHDPLEPALVERMLDTAHGAGRFEEARRAFDAYRARLAEEVDERPDAAIRARAALRLAPTIPSQAALPESAGDLESSEAGRYLAAVWRTASGTTLLASDDRQALWRLTRASGGMRVALEAMALAVATTSAGEAAALWQARSRLTSSAHRVVLREVEDPWRRLDDAMELMWRALPEDERFVLARIATLEAPLRFELAARVLPVDAPLWRRWREARFLVTGERGAETVLPPLRAWLANATTSEEWSRDERALAAALLEAFVAALARPNADLDAVALDLPAIEAAWETLLRLAEPAELDATLPAWDRWHRLRGDFAAARQRFEAVAERAEEFADGTAVRARALAHAGHMAFRQGRQRDAQRLLDEAEGVPLRKEDAAMVSQVRGAMAFEAGDVEGAERGFGRRLEIARELGDLRSEAEALNNLALVDRLARRSDAAAQRLQEAIALLRSLGDERGAGSAQLNLALLEASRGAYGAYADAARVALKLLERAPKLTDRALARANLADALCLTGPLDEARRQAERALEEATEAGLVQYVVSARTALGRAWAVSGERERAATELALAEQEAGVEAGPEVLRLIYSHRAWLAFWSGQLAEAERWTRAALRQAELSGAGTARYEALFARLAVRRADLQAARAALRRAEVASAYDEDVSVEAALLEAAVEIAGSLGERAEVLESAQRALGVADDSGRLAERVGFRIAIGEVLLAEGDDERALTVHAEAFEVADRGRSLPLLRACDLLEARLLAAAGRLEQAEAVARRVARARQAGAFERRAARQALSLWRSGRA